MRVCLYACVFSLKYFYYKNCTKQYYSKYSTVQYTEQIQQNNNKLQSVVTQCPEKSKLWCSSNVLLKNMLPVTAFPYVFIHCTLLDMGTDPV